RWTEAERGKLEVWLPYLLAGMVCNNIYPVDQNRKRRKKGHLLCVVEYSGQTEGVAAVVGAR
ncbi:hypothetical protein ACQP3F_30260, partial [Escherichia coli]